MSRRSLLFLGLLLETLEASSAPSAQAPSSGQAWAEKGAAFYEELLRTGDIVDVAPVGRGGLRPGRVYLRQAGRRIEAVFKSVVAGPRQGFWESHQAEVAAYELDKLLGLGLVPPTVLRDVEGKHGSLQLWVDGCREWQESAAEPLSLESSQSLSRIRTFDELLGNRDRDRGNLLVDPAGNFLLIDHSRAFIAEKELSPALPERFDGNLLGKMRALDKRQLMQAVRGLLSEAQVEALLARRDSILARVQRLIQQKGEASVLF
jgi:hypothetical protein